MNNMKTYLPYYLITALLAWLYFTQDSQRIYATHNSLFEQPDARYPPLPVNDHNGKWYAWYEFMGNVNQQVQQRNYPRLEQMVLEVRDTKPRYANFSWVLHELYNAIPNALPDYPEIHAMVADWQLAIPESNVPDIIAARAYFAEAWDYRGNGYAHTISSENYEQFRIHLEQAWQAAEVASNKGPPDAELCSLRTELAFAYHRDKTLAKHIFNECLAIEPGYFHLFYKVNRYLQPIWMGSDKEHQLFVNQAADVTRDIYGDGLYAMLMSATSFYHGRIFAGYGGSFSWERARTGFRDVLKNTGPSSDYIHHIFAYCAMLAHDHQTVAEMLTILGTQWDEDKARNFRVRAWYDQHLRLTQKYL
jgi:hypothetical protein